MIHNYHYYNLITDLLPLRSCSSNHLITSLANGDSFFFMSKLSTTIVKDEKSKYYSEI